MLIEVESVSEVEPFQIDKSDYGNMDDWLPVGEISNVKGGDVMWPQLLVDRIR